MTSPPVDLAARGGAVFVPLPDRDFDVTEVAVPWKLLTEAGHPVVFATGEGATPAGSAAVSAGSG